MTKKLRQKFKYLNNEKSFQDEILFFIICKWLSLKQLKQLFLEGKSLTLSVFCRYCFGRCSSELAQLVLLPFSWGRSTCYSDRLLDFSVTIPRCYEVVYVNSFFLCTAWLWNSLPIECFSLNYNLNGFKFRINRHLLTVGSF